MTAPRGDAGRADLLYVLLCVLVVIVIFALI